ncbi:MAG: tRNA epoxyqueuosine(34) reductase QueG [Phycisphaerales bacterium]|nr:MAG: tRNA epoxyqueuosine(34) reductase QueG [Phycisphaerales bacterium]
MAVMSLEQEIKHRALELGFDAVGITDTAPIANADIERLRAWLDSGAAGEMAYLHRNFEKRIHPAALLEGAQSVIVVALNYKPPEDEGSLPAPEVSSGEVTTYACYEDYHDFMRPLLHKLADFIRARTDGMQLFKVCVDSAPLAERALAVRAGLGFIGKSHMFIHPTLGPQVFLGELVTTVKLRPDDPTLGACVGCDRCLHACPTGALSTDGRFDANRCISYLTIEHKGAVASELAAKMGDRIFGCDECVRVCPYHHAAPARANQRFRFYHQRARLDLSHVLELSLESFAAEFAGSPVARTGHETLQRNARICLANAKRDRSSQKNHARGDYGDDCGKVTR